MKKKERKAKNGEDTACQVGLPYDIVSFNREAQKAGIAQLVEQRTENPRVTSSSLVPGKIYDSSLSYDKHMEVSGVTSKWRALWKKA